MEIRNGLVGREQRAAKMRYEKPLATQVDLKPEEFLLGCSKSCESCKSSAPPNQKEKKPSSIPCGKS